MMGGISAPVAWGYHLGPSASFPEWWSGVAQPSAGALSCLLRKLGKFTSFTTPLDSAVLSPPVPQLIIRQAPSRARAVA